LDKMYYSVPYDYIKHRVDVRLTKDIVEIFYNHFRVASHKRLYGEAGQASTNPDHMPDKHKQFINFNREYVLDWA
ncbi:Mu transposase domain-containing protein, partial [Staphylococcus epidermidis]